MLGVKNPVLGGSWTVGRLQRNRLMNRSSKERVGNLRVTLAAVRKRDADAPWRATREEANPAAAEMVRLASRKASEHEIGRAGERERVKSENRKRSPT